MVFVCLLCHNSIGKTVYFMMTWMKELGRAILALPGHAKTLQHAHGVVHNPNMLVAVLAAKYYSG